MNRNWKEWLKAAAIRAVRTFAQTALSMITIGQAFAEVNWISVISVSGVAAVLSILTSLAGLPEVSEQFEPQTTINEDLDEEACDENSDDDSAEE